MKQSHVVLDTFVHLLIISSKLSSQKEMRADVCTAGAAFLQRMVCSHKSLRTNPYTTHLRRKCLFSTTLYRRRQKNFHQIWQSISVSAPHPSLKVENSLSTVRSLHKASAIALKPNSFKRWRERNCFQYMSWNKCDGKVNYIFCKLLLSGEGASSTASYSISFMPYNWESKSINFKNNN